MKIAHLTSVHARYDNRILAKECASLAKHGLETFLFVADGLGLEIVKGVTIVDVGKKRNIFHRMFVIAPKIVWRAIRLRPEIYHFHDPELIPAGLILRAFGKRVIYDIHEDYQTSIQQKTYIPKIVAHVIALVFSVLERFGARFFTNIIAEKYYARRFPISTPILNYPIINDVPSSIGEPPAILSDPTRNAKLLYTGNITLDRGALSHAKVVSYLEAVEVVMVGKCTSQLAEEMIKSAGEGRDRLTIEGINTFIRPERINYHYSNGQWTAGLALFPKTKHYEKKELTKFFEYMKFGLPIICSDFPAWKALIEENGVGIAVDPENPEEIEKAVSLLRKPGLRQAMGEKGRQLVRCTFNWRQEEIKLLTLYDKLLQRI